MDDLARARALLEWYPTVARPLPWRRVEALGPDDRAWRVLLSELMLQQTRVETVIPYYERFVARWPTAARMAAEPVQAVLEAWAGLGYYSRARNLHACAVALATGVTPRTVDGLRALPGVGPYTAGAVASIAWGVATPLVDGNVERVLCRWHNTDLDPRSVAGRQAMWAWAGSLVAAMPAGGSPGDLNQALMELGATVCTPKSPRCGGCPVADGCAGRARAEQLPCKAAKAPPKEIVAEALVVRRGSTALLARRLPGGLLGGLWEPPRADGAVDAGGLRSTLEALGLVPIGAQRVAEVRHVFTHRRLACGVWSGEVAGTPVPGGVYDAVAFVDPSTVGLSTLAVKLLDAVAPLPLGFGRPPRPGAGRSDPEPG
jgi:A/G-specific adenine glycosylase